MSELQILWSELKNFTKSNTKQLFNDILSLIEGLRPCILIDHIFVDESNLVRMCNNLQKYKKFNCLRILKFTLKTTNYENMYFLTNINKLQNKLQNASILDSVQFISIDSDSPKVC